MNFALISILERRKKTHAFSDMCLGEFVYLNSSAAVRGRLFSRTFKIIIRAFVLFMCFFTRISSKLAIAFSL